MTDRKPVATPQEAVLRIMRGETLFIDDKVLDPGWSQNWSITTIRRLVTQERLFVKDDAPPLNLFLTVYWPQVGDEVTESVWFDETDAANEAKRLNLKLGINYSHYGERPVPFEPPQVHDPMAFMPIASAPRDGRVVTIKDDEGNTRKMQFTAPFWWTTARPQGALRILDPHTWSNHEPSDFPLVDGDMCRAEEWRA